MDRYQIEIMKEKEIDETLDREELGYIPFTYVRNTHENIVFWYNLEYFPKILDIDSSESLMLIFVTLWSIDTICMVFDY